MSQRGRVRSLGTTLTRRVWSRAVPVADALAASPNRRRMALSWRIVLHMTGCAIIAAGVAGMLWNDFGPGPLDVLIGAIRIHTGLPLTLAVWATTGSLLGVAWMLGKRPGLGNVVTVLTVGPLMQLTLERLHEFAPPDAFALKVVVHVLATAVVGLGAGINLFARLGAGTGELLASAAAHRTGFTEPRVRMAFELTWLTAGVAIGGPVGVGTVIVAVLIGPFVARGHRTVDGAITGARVATLRQLAAARPALPARATITGSLPVTVCAGD
jgi:uncharacterized membrane protein YczE